MSSSQSIYIHGHRGSRGTHPENTFAAFEEARNSGADFFEIDVRLSADAIPVVYHDSHLSSRLCLDPTGNPLDRQIPLRQLTAEAIGTYQIGRILDPRFPSQKQIPLAGIPTLEAVLVWLADKKKDIGINIELKVDSEEADLLARIVLELVRQYALLSRSIIQSFELRSLAAIRRIVQDANLSCLFDSEEDFAEKALSIGSQMVGPRSDLLSAKKVAECRTKGIRVVPWTVNDPMDWERLLTLGVDGIITDYPRKLSDYLGRGSKRDAKNG